MRLRVLIVLVAGCLVGPTLVQGAEPGWYGRVVLPPAERAVIERTPILERPYRPLHFYGNTVRRRHYRGTALPVPRMGRRRGR